MNGYCTSNSFTDTVLLLANMSTQSSERKVFHFQVEAEISIHLQFIWHKIEEVKDFKKAL